MAEDSLRDVIDSACAGLQGELETQLRVVAERHQQLLAAARQQIEADAEHRWNARLEAVKSEHDQHLEAALTALRTEMERAPVGSLSDHADSLLRGLREIEAASSVSDSLAAIARAAAAEAPRAALFLANGTDIDEWAVSGIPPLSGGSLKTSDPSYGIVVEAMTRGQAVRNNGSACAIPLLLDGAPIGVLYGEADADGPVDDAWPDCLEAVARYGAGRLGYLTALRTAQARQWLENGDSTLESAAGRPRRSGEPSSPSVEVEDETAATSARRYARLVVSELKLYNEAAVQTGRSRRDLSQRLGPEIERARRLYEERVPASVAGRATYFQQELVQTLAGGDPSLLG
ncbi:hypothetical protein BH24ACI5_BH24ACI5_25140 [soil metagenome]